MLLLSQARAPSSWPQLPSNSNSPSFFMSTCGHSNTMEWAPGPPARPGRSAQPTWKSAPGYEGTDLMRVSSRKIRYLASSANLLASLPASHPPACTKPPGFPEVPCFDIEYELDSLSSLTGLSVCIFPLLLLFFLFLSLHSSVVLHRVPSFLGAPRRITDTARHSNSIFPQTPPHDLRIHNSTRHTH